MSPNELNSELRKIPFVPFRMFLTNGTIYEIRHPELVMPGLRAAIIGFPAGPEGGYYASYTVVSLLHVIRLEPIEEATVEGNGS